ncbi:MAG: NAD(P)-dependent dehydrogenase (short-subunit alcohol dehydrogenase family) [Candidatus Aldehydirespiratoraceae bacterium]|jgi:NAD(P)-dependent dehydrogenase (short-subunit alcohol dehydrogenase family)
MQDFEGRTAVITGGASGIGLATAERLAQAGMQLVLADIEEKVLVGEVARLEAEGHTVLGVATNVADFASVKALATTATERFGNIHIVFNNAGVSGGGPMLADDLDVWGWTLGVNLYGVVHGIKAFGPAMLAHGEPCHIVNTASMAGLLPTPGMGVYTASKYAVTAMSETLSLETQGTNLGVSVLCPGFVQTRIADSDRNLPEHMVSALDEPSEHDDGVRAMVRDLVNGGIPPAEVAELILEGIIEGRFYLLPHPQYFTQVIARGENIAAGGLPISWSP